MAIVKKKSVKKTVKKKVDQKSKQAKVTELRYRAFALEYIKDFNASRAAEACGYSKRTASQQGSRLLSNVKIQGYIAEAMKKRVERTQYDADWVLKQAAKVHLRCMQEEPVLDAEGSPTGEYKFEHSGANKALEIVGKHVNVRAFDTTVKLDATDEVKTILSMLPSTLGPPGKRRSV